MYPNNMPILRKGMPPGATSFKKPRPSVAPDTMRDGWHGVVCVAMYPNNLPILRKGMPPGRSV
jgi:hypothetical protein